MIRQRIKALAATVATAAMLLAGATPAMAASGRPAFTDLAGTAHVEDVTWAAGQGIIKGYNDGTFGGMRDVVRQDMAAFLYRLAGSPDFDQTAAERANKFSDVTPAISHYKEVLWLATTGITKGYGDGTFGVMRTVVRQDMAAFLHRYATNVLHAQEPGGNPQTFPDVNATTSHYEDIIWLSRTSITTGYNDGTFGGMRTVVRQDMAAFLHRTHDNLKVEQQADVKVKKVVTEQACSNYSPARSAAPCNSTSTTYAVDSNNIMWAWGYNDSGLIGDGTTTNRTTPYKVPGLPKISNITTVYGTIYATGEDGSLWAWGYNGSGQIGDGTTTKRPTPYKVPGLPKITSVTTSDGTVYATGEDGSLWAWGYNDSGQIGDGTTTKRPTPYKVNGLPKIAKVISNSFSTAYAIGEDGTLWAWGGNGYGGIGDGTTNNRLTPYQVPGLSKIANVAIGAYGTAYATSQDGTLWAWGNNFYGQIGDGTTEHRLTPYKMPIAAKVANIIADYGYSTVYAIGDDGSLWTWGSNVSGQIGDGTSGYDESRTTPYKVNGLPQISDISTSTNGYMEGTAYATGKDGSLWTWGYNGQGQIGDGTTTNRTTPYRVVGLPKITSTSITANGSTTYATGEDGSLWAWGQNRYGQVGDGTTTDRITPYKVLGLSKIANITTGGYSTAYATGEDGNLWAWGYNGSGEIGDGTTTNRTNPVKVQFKQ